MKMKKLLLLLLTMAMIFASLGLTAFAEDEVTGKDPVAGVKIPFGVYEPDETLLHEGSHELKITCDRVHVTHTFTAEIAFSSENYTEVKIGEKTYERYLDPKSKKAIFMLPVEINEPLTFTAHTTAMSGQDIPYTVTIKLNANSLKPVQNGALTDGFYTTTVNTNKAAFGWKIASSGALQNGFSYPSKDYNIPVTVEIKDGKIANVAYTQDVCSVDVNSVSDVNYLMWAMNGHTVTDKCYQSKTVSNGATYHIDPVGVKNGTGLKEQFVGKTDIAGVDTVSAATLTSRVVIDAVDQSLTKAERGQKDDPDPELPGPDTTDDIVPKDGYYFVGGRCIGADLDDEKDTIIHVEDGKITLSALYVQERSNSYSHLFSGTEAEAIAAGENIPVPVAYEHKYKYSGTKYSDMEIKSLDKYQLFQIYAVSSETWFNRPMIFDSDTLRPTTEENVAVTDAFDNMEMVLFFNNATPSEEDAAAAKQPVYTAIDALTASLDSDKYTDDSIENVIDAAAELKDTIADADATQDDMRDAKSALDDAVTDLEPYPYTVVEDDGERKNQNDTTNNVVYSSIGMFRILDAGTTVTKDGDKVTVKVKISPLASGNYDRMALIDYPEGTAEEIAAKLDDHAIDVDRIEEIEGPNGQTGEMTTLYSPEFTFQIKASEVGKKIPFVYSQNGKWKTKAYYLIVLTDEEAAKRKAEIEKAAREDSENAVEAAQAIVADKGKYEAESYAAFEQALKELEEVLAKEGATAAEINAAKTALEDAIAGLKKAAVVKKANPMTVKAKTVKIKYSTLKKKTQKVKKAKAFTVKKAEGTVSFKLANKDKKAKSKITVSKKGVITVKKGLKKGKYTIKVKVTAKGNDAYNSKNKTVKVVIRVK